MQITITIEAKTTADTDTQALKERVMQALSTITNNDRSDTGITQLLTCKITTVITKIPD